MVTLKVMMTKESLKKVEAEKVKRSGGDKKKGKKSNKKRKK